MEKNRDFGALFEHSNFKIPISVYIHLPNQTSFINYLVAMVAFSQNLCDFIDLFFIRKLHKSPFISTMATIKIIPHK